MYLSESNGWGFIGVSGNVGVYYGVVVFFMSYCSGDSDNVMNFIMLPPPAKHCCFSKLSRFLNYKIRSNAVFINQLGEIMRRGLEA